MPVADPVLEVDAPAAERERIERLVLATLAREDGTLERVDVGFVDASAMRELNRAHRGKDRPTDVLSFPFDDRFPQGSGGQVAVCPELADPPGPATVDRLIVHGVLHLLGYEDETDSGLAEMERRTDAITEAVDAA